MLLPIILVRSQIRDMLGGETGKITFGRIKYKFRTSSKKFQFVYNIPCISTLVRVRTARLLVSICDSVCHAEGFGLFLAKGCACIAALTPVNKNFLWSFRHKSIGELFMLDQACGREASPRWSSETVLG
jgi:hypothetical protein